MFCYNTTPSGIREEKERKREIMPQIFCSKKICTGHEAEKVHPRVSVLVLNRFLCFLRQQFWNWGNWCALPRGPAWPTIQPRVCQITFQLRILPFFCYIAPENVTNPSCSAPCASSLTSFSSCATELSRSFSDCVLARTFLICFNSVCNSITFFM